MFEMSNAALCFGKFFDVAIEKRWIALYAADSYKLISNVRAYDFILSFIFDAFELRFKLDDFIRGRIMKFQRKYSGK